MALGGRKYIRLSSCTWSGISADYRPFACIPQLPSIDRSRFLSFWTEFNFVSLYLSPTVRGSFKGQFSEFGDGGVFLDYAHLMILFFEVK